MSYYPAISRAVYGQTTVKAGDTVQASGAAANVYQPFASTYTLPANSLVQGLELVYEFNGLFTTAALGPTSTLSIIVGGVEVVNTGALMMALGVSNYGYYGKVILKVQSVGTSGVVRAFGKVDFQDTAAGRTLSHLIPSTDKTVNTTINNLLSFQIAFSNNNTGNFNTLRDVTIYEVRPPRSAN